MKIVNIIGGIGNQMFQYAFALALQEKYPHEEIKLDVTHFSGYGLHNGFEIERVFGSQLPYASVKDLMKVTYYAPYYKLSRLIRKVFGYRKSEYKEPRLFTYWGDDVFHIEADCYYEGSWQNEKYFKDYRDKILKAFTFKNPLSERNLNLQNQINCCNSVSIHVRRGDYLKDPTYKGICDLPYYINAIKIIKSKVDNPHFFIFSNDAEWCRRNIANLCENYTIVDWNQGALSSIDIQLMSYCKHNIIAHSSFSWWGTWLNVNPQKIVIAPKGWFNREDITDYPHLEDWILVENE